MHLTQCHPRSYDGEQPKAVEDYQAGKNGALNFLVGQAMKKTRGRADPGELNRLMVEGLKSRSGDLTCT